MDKVKLINNTSKNRFELYVSDTFAIVEYIQHKDKLIVYNTHIPSSLSMVNEIPDLLLQLIKQECKKLNLTFDAQCPYLKARISLERG